MNRGQKAELASSEGVATSQNAASADADGTAGVGAEDAEDDRQAGVLPGENLDLLYLVPPPPGVPPEEKKKENNMSTSEVDTDDNSSSFKTKTGAPSVIVRHNPRPKRSTAGSVYNTWKEKWSSR